MEEKRKEAEKKWVLHQLRVILKSKAKKMKSNLNKSYKSLNPAQMGMEEERVDQLNSSIRMVERDLGIEEDSTHRSYFTQQTVESVEKDQTIGNESILSIEHVIKRHEFVLTQSAKAERVDVVSEESRIRTDFS